MIAFAMLTELISNYSKSINILPIILILFPFCLLANDDLEIEIDGPKFSEKGLDNRLYEIKAERGIQRKDDLKLFSVEGKLRTESGIWIYLNAKEGNFNQLKNLIELNGEIIFYTDEDDKFQSDYALFSINDDLVKFKKNVKHNKGDNIITSDESIIHNNFNHIIYKNNVRMIYDIE